jgi:phosphatidate phosphatase PAH1
VDIYVNGQQVPFKMHMGDKGDAYFIHKEDQKGAPGPVEEPHPASLVQTVQTGPAAEEPSENAQ